MGLLAEIRGINSPEEEDPESESLTSAHWGSSAPKFHMVAGYGTSSSEVTEDISSSIGFGSATDEVAIGVSSMNGMGSTITDRSHQTGKSVYPLDWSPYSGTYVFEEAELDSYAANNVTLDWTEVEGDELDYFLLALGGDDLEEVSVDHITTPTSTGDVSYTGPGFQPDCLICLGVYGSGSLPYTDAHMAAQFGLSDGTTSAGLYAVSLDGRSAASVTHSVLSSNFIHLTNGFGVNETLASVASLDASGYTLNYSLTGSAKRVTIIAIKGPSAKVIASTQPTTNSTVDLDAGFVPSAGICLGAMKTESETASDHNRFTIGAWTDTDGANHQHSMGWMDEDAVGVSDADRYISDNTAIKNYEHTQTCVGSATVSVQGNGIRETWSNTDGSEYAHVWLLLGDVPSAASGNPWNYYAQQGGV